MTIKTTDLTTGEVSGSGFFDELMRTSKAHLLDEFKKGRITGVEYSQVYRGVSQGNLQVASQFLLQQDINNQQTLLLQEQIIQAKKQNELAEQQLVQSKYATYTAEYTYNNILPLQKAQLEEQVALVQLQYTQLELQNLLTQEQTKLVTVQIASELGKTVTPTEGLNKVAFDKGNAEIAILEKKLAGEAAQTEGTVETTNGLIGAEMQLKKVQADSFLRDAEQKATKLYSDVFAVLYSTNPENLYSNEWGFGSDESQKAIEALMKGIDINYSGSVPDPTTFTPPA